MRAAASGRVPVCATIRRVKRSTAVSRLNDVAEGLERAAQWPKTTVTAAYAFGSLLDADANLDRIDLALVVAEPAADVPWMARPAHLEALASMLRFTKLPLSWQWRPTEWPVWNHHIDCAIRFWTADDGRDERVLAAFAAGEVDDRLIERPGNNDELVAQLLVERAVGRRHLAKVTECFYDQDWRRAHRGDGIHAEDHLWWATAAYLDLDDALHRLGP
jgi:hypothetical protein